jgi:hypothetical protein
MGGGYLPDAGLGALEDCHFYLPLAPCDRLPESGRPIGIEYRCKALRRQGATFVPLAWELQRAGLKLLELAVIRGINQKIVIGTSLC